MQISLENQDLFLLPSGSKYFPLKGSPRIFSDVFSIVQVKGFISFWFEKSQENWKSIFTIREKPKNFIYEDEWQL